MTQTVRNLLVALACLVGLLGAAAFAAFRQAHRPVSEIVVNIANDSDNYFISERGVTALLTNGGKEPVLGTVPEGPRLRVLEARLKAHPFVRDAQVYRDLAGNHCTTRTRRRPPR
jgi:cell division protein FtsQ